MREIDADNTAEYLRETGRLEPGEAVEVRELTGGVSNMVLYVARPERQNSDFVLKQARRQLRTPQPWFSSLERIWREIDVLTACREILDERAKMVPWVGGPELPAITVPRIQFVDRDNYLFAMSAAPPSALTWKQCLLAGDVQPQIAAACGWLLGTLHGRSWGNRELAARLADRTLFDQLRIDPYYRTLAAVHPALEPQIARLIASLGNDSHLVSLVHADFSPKNLLVSPVGLVLVDFETGHFGDPAFDLGFFLSHLLLKACRAAPAHEGCLALAAEFWRHYTAQLEGPVSTHQRTLLEARGVLNLAGCLLARIDGKSQIDYLDNAARQVIRDLATGLLLEPPARFEEVFDLCQRKLDNFRDPVP